VATSTTTPRYADDATLMPALENERSSPVCSLGCYRCWMGWLAPSVTADARRAGEPLTPKQPSATASRTARWCACAAARLVLLTIGQISEDSGSPRRSWSGPWRPTIPVGLVATVMTLVDTSWGCRRRGLLGAVRFEGTRVPGDRSPNSPRSR
jgi:hypothetical protein